MPGVQLAIDSLDRLVELLEERGGHAPASEAAAHVFALRRAPDNDSELVAGNINVLLQRVAGTSVQDIDRLIGELQTLRDVLQSEGARVQREITQYAHLSQSAMQSTRVIAESLQNWKAEGTLRATRN
jgi:hypothetical protein